MTALTADLSLAGEVVRVDGPLTVGESYHLEDEVVIVRASVIENYTDVTTGDRWRVKRGADHTTQATHASGTALTLARLYEAGGAGAGGVTVDNQSDPPAEVTTLIVPSATIDGSEATILPGVTRVSTTDPLIVQAAAGSEASGGPIFYVAGEVDNEIMSLNAYGNLVLRGSMLDPTNDGASLQVFGPDQGVEVFGVVADNVEANSVIRLGVAETTIGFFGTAAAAKPTGVAVTAEAIHAALVTLGLIEGP